MSCLLPDCNREPRTRGMCNSHYEKWRKGRLNVEPLPYRQPKVCSIEGCGRIYASRGFCDLHVRRLREWGDPRPDIPPRTEMVAAECSVDGCGRPVDARGWCRSHYDRWRKHRDIQADVPINFRAGKPHPDDCDLCEESEWASRNWVPASRIADACGMGDTAIRNHLTKFRPDLLGWFYRTRSVAS